MKSSVVVLRLSDEPAAPLREGAASGSPVRTLGVVVLAAGAAVTVGAALADLLFVPARIEAFEDAVDAADPAAAEHTSDAEHWQAISIGAYVGGAALLAGGAALWLFGRSGAEEQAPRVGVGPGGVAVEGRF